MFAIGRSKIKPAIVKIKGKAEDIAFLDHAMRGLMGGCEVRHKWTLKGRKPFVDSDGCNEIVLTSGNDFRVVNKMAETLGIQVISIAYGSIPKDDRPLNKCTMTYTVTHNGRSAVFDLSVS
ncbi:MAG: hypothetical protein JSS83_27685 [Cyanobacteria bacterium SZAS LIN-3]|nr:hypothetical protein [Cyanobacteria bacterium SZAS LIN-3]MBS2007375.1 hypothetical protein [Cyanobacteria bacterium SZAS TMP-1]